MLKLLRQAPWAANRTEAQHQNAYMNSVILSCKDITGELVGALRFITDRATVTYLCDTIVDEAHRGQGIGTRLMQMFLEHPDVKGTTIVLLTQGAEEFYRKFGFAERTAMIRRPDATS